MIAALNRISKFGAPASSRGHLVLCVVSVEGIAHAGRPIGTHIPAFKIVGEHNLAIGRIEQGRRAEKCGQNYCEEFSGEWWVHKLVQTKSDRPITTSETNV